MTETATAAPDTEPPIDEALLASAARKVNAYYLTVALSTLGFLGFEVFAAPALFAQPVLLVWVAVIALVDMFPIETSSDLSFSLSFPLELALALIYPPAIAAAVTFAGTTDLREIRREIGLTKALFIRGQIAMSVGVQSLVFHAVASFDSPWYVFGGGVLLATVVGYAINALLVAFSIHLEHGDSVGTVLREMHKGIIGEFLVSYTGLALFGVVLALFWVTEGVWSILVFVGPMAFARQMFVRTHSLNKAHIELERREREKEHQASHDSLTGLPNRVLFLDRLDEAITSARENRRGVAVMILDLDHFKDINDTLGHHYGDLLLQEIGPKLQSLLREEDTIARLGGDEFGIILPELQSLDTAVDVVTRLLEQLEAPIPVEGFTLDVSASIGISLFPEHSEDVETLLRRADVAMYVAKEARNGYELYSPERDRYSPARLAMLGQVRPAIENGEFVLHYQPRAQMSDGAVRGVEALVRWKHPQRGLLAPEEFIPVVERTVALAPLTHFVLEEALKQSATWRRIGIDLSMSVNLSPRNLIDPNLPEQVLHLLDKWAVPPSSLIIEITESTLMADSARCTEVLAQLAAAGVELSIDDFGTGYSSLGYLKRVPVTELKIDRSFVINMGADPNDRLIVRAAVDLSHNLGLRVVAEGVESYETWRELESFECDIVQGYFLSRPLPDEGFRRWLEQYKRRQAGEWNLDPLKRSGRNGAQTHLDFSRPIQSG
ncbi:MAG: putative bifunctional diguanylate cyclase/phosphodiesterase [Actinomycetota bacterium]